MARTIRWRTGRRVGRTIYLQRGDEPSDHDQLVGVMDTFELAAQAVDAVNNGRPAEVTAMRRFQIVVSRALEGEPWEVMAEGVEFGDGTVVVRPSDKALYVYSAVEQAVNMEVRVGWFRRIKWIDDQEQP